MKSIITTLITLSLIGCGSGSAPEPESAEEFEKPIKQIEISFYIDDAPKRRCPETWIDSLANDDRGQYYSVYTCMQDEGDTSVKYVSDHNGGCKEEERIVEILESGTFPSGLIIDYCNGQGVKRRHIK